MNSELISFKDDFESSLQCPICMEFFTSIIFQCDSGHSLCEVCCSKISVCPLCKSQIGKRIRNFLLEDQLTRLTIRCKFESCGVIIKLCEKPTHEQNCAHNPECHCILQHCKWAGHKNSMIEHLVEKHKVPHYTVQGNSAEYSSRLRSANLQAAAGCVKLLHTFLIAGRPATTILTYIFLDSCRNLFYPQFRTIGEGENKFNLRIWNVENEEIVIEGVAYNQRCGLDEEREKKLCVIFDLESLISKFSFVDKQEKGHKLLHYRLSI